MGKQRKKMMAVCFLIVLGSVLLIVHYGLSSEGVTGTVVNEEAGNIEENQKLNVPNQKPIADAPENNLVEDTVLTPNEQQLLEEVLILVNRQEELSAQYVPEDLVVPDVRFSFDGPHEKKHLRRVAADALEQLFKGADEQGIELYAVSGYRSYTRQQSVYNGHVQRLGEAEANKVSAIPGQSEHQTGLAMDVSSRSAGFTLTESFAETKEGQWLAGNAHRFGFIIRYPKGEEAVTGYSYEPWHIRYVGEDAAKAIYDSNLTLEAFLSQGN